MTPKLTVVTTTAPQKESSIRSEENDGAATAALPDWWLGTATQFSALADMRARIHRNETTAAKKAESILAGVLIAAVSIYSVDATGAMSIPAAPGFLVLVLAVAVPAMAAWLLDRRLIQQLNDIDLRSNLWIELVSAIKHGRVDTSQLECGTPSENPIERLLRRETAIAAQFVASKNPRSPHLPIFGRCFTLQND
ncbi:MAG TPA: hypothetical protein VF816_03990 [Rhodocyclaceae bacterium]